MSKKALLGIDSLTGSQLIYHEEDGKTYVERRQDCTQLVEAAKILAERPPDKDTGWRFLCVIDDATYERSIREGWFHDKTAWRAWMNNRDNRALNGGRENVG